MDARIVFVFRFFVVVAFAYWLVWVLDFSHLENAIAAFEAALFNLDVSGNAIFIENEIFLISSYCTGLVSAGILAGVVFAFRKPRIIRKISIFVSGLFVLMFINVVRVAVVLLAGKEFGIGAAELVHSLSWFAMCAVIILLWYYLTKRYYGFSGLQELV